MKRQLAGFLKLLTLVSLTAYLSSSCTREVENKSKGSEITDKAIEITDKAGKPTVIYEESHALVIWAGNYQHWSQLNNVGTEAKKVVKTLEKRGFQVTVVDNPTGSELKSAIEDFFVNYGYKPDNRLVIFFTGHGHTRNQTKGYLVPVDAPDPTSISNEPDFLNTAFSMQRMMFWAKEIEAKHVLFVFDSCFSGTLFKTKAPPKIENAYVRDVMAKPVRQFITAGDADQEVPAKSIFTPLFIRALEGEADFIEDGYVTGTELGVYLTQKLNEYPLDQTPQYGKIRDADFDRGDIVFRSLKKLISSNLPPQVPETNPSEDDSKSLPTVTPSIVSLLENIETQYQKRNYQDCYQLAMDNLYRDNSVVKEWIYNCGLEAAKIKAEANSYSGAIAIAQTIPNTVSNYQEVKDSINTWSGKILDYAIKVYKQQGRIEEAVKITKFIPDDTNVKTTIPEIISQWRRKESMYQDIMNKAESLLNQGQWDAAKKEVEKIPPDFKFWRLKAQPILNEANKQINAIISKATRANYSKLRELLAEQRWKEADQTTTKLIVQATNVRSIKDINKFFCEDLRIIDQLWRIHSLGKFGFRVQKKIWEKNGSPMLKEQYESFASWEKDWARFEKDIGWKYEGWNLIKRWDIWNKKREYIKREDLEGFRDVNTSKEGNLPCLLGQKWGGDLYESPTGRREFLYDVFSRCEL